MTPPSLRSPHFEKYQHDVKEAAELLKNARQNASVDNASVDKNPSFFFKNFFTGLKVWFFAWKHEYFIKK
jgi:hypothetical protein